MSASKPVQLSPHFSSDEVKCPHCGAFHVDMRLINALEELRSLAGKPLKVTSAYRCAEHNKAIGGAPKSEHVSGLAADVACPRGLDVVKFAALAAKVPAFAQGGIGIYDQNFIHVDVRTSGPARWARIAGKYVSFESGVAALTKKGKA